MFKENIDRILLVAILIVGLIGVFGGKKNTNIGATDYSRTTRMDSVEVGSFMGAVNAISASTASYTLTPNDICNSSYILVTPATTTTTVTLPATSTALFSTCLGQIGSFRDFAYQSVSTSTVIAAGAGSTLGYSASTTVAAGKHAIIRVVRDSLSTYDILLTNITN